LRTNLSDGLKEYLDANHKRAPLLGTDRVKIFEIGTVFPKRGELVSVAYGVSGKTINKTLEETKKTLKARLNSKISAEPKDGVVEFSFSKLIEDLSSPKEYEPFERTTNIYKPISPYPFVLRDISLWVPLKTKEEDILEVLNLRGGDLLVKKTLFDRFEKERRTSYAFRLVFQSHEKTLSDEEINKIMEKITTDLNKIEGFEVR